MTIYIAFIHIPKTFNSNKNFKLNQKHALDSQNQKPSDRPSSHCVNHEKVSIIIKQNYAILKIPTCTVAAVTVSKRVLVV